MQKLKQEIITLFENHKIFEIKLKNESKSLESREDIFKKLVSGENIEDDGEKLKNFYKDFTLKTGQYHFNAQQLKQFIEFYIRHENDLPKEILEEYEILRQKYNTKPLFILENEEFVVTDEEYLNVARKELENNELFKMLASK